MSLSIKDFTLFFTDIHMINVVLLLIFIDVIAGISTALFINKNFLSKSSYVGYLKKLGILTAIVIANVLDIILGLDGVLLVASVWFYIFYEASSILEHLAAWGVPIPNWLLDALEVVKKKGDLNNDNQ